MPSLGALAISLHGDMAKCNKISEILENQSSIQVYNKNMKITSLTRNTQDLVFE